MASRTRELGSQNGLPGSHEVSVASFCGSVKGREAFKTAPPHLPFVKSGAWLQSSPWVQPGDTFWPECGAEEELQDTESGGL